MKTTARTYLDLKSRTTRRAAYPNIVINRVRAQRQTARDNATLILAGLTLPAPALHGHSALHRQQAIDAYGRRLELIVKAEFARNLLGDAHASEASAFVSTLLGEIESGALRSSVTHVPAAASLQ